MNDYCRGLSGAQIWRSERNRAVSGGWVARFRSQTDTAPHFRQISVVVLLLTLFALPVQAAEDPMELMGARYALEAGEAAHAIRQIRPHLGSNPEAQFLMGRILEEGGRGVSRNPGQAITWYARAAEGGHADAAYALGRLFERGDPREATVPTNFREARRWYARGAAANHVDSQVHLGLMLTEGRGGPRDITEGLAWLTVAEEAGAPAARRILAHRKDSLRSEQRKGIAERARELRATLSHAEPRPNGSR